MSNKKIKIINNRFINKYFYISTLSQWHFSCEPEFKELWLKDDSPLTVLENKALQNFSKIAKKYGFEDQKGKSVYLGIPFITSASGKAWNNVSNWVNQEEFKQLKNIFVVFEPRFKNVWLKNKNRLENITNLLEKSFSDLKFKQIISDLEILLGKIGKIKLLEVYLQMAPEKTEIVGGGANFSVPDKITLEIGSKNKITEYLQVIFHELTHFYIHNLDKQINEVIEENQDLLAIIKNSRIVKERGIRGVLEELLTLIIFPDGVLGHKYFTKNVIKFKKELFNKPVKITNSFEELELLTKFIIVKALPELTIKLKNEQKLDKYFVKKLLVYWVEFKNKIGK